MSTAPFYRSHDLPTCRGIDGARCPRAPEPDGYCIEHGAIIEARAPTIVADFTAPWNPANQRGRQVSREVEELRAKLWQWHAEDEEVREAWARQQAGRDVPL